jgi:hypothetical protein
MIGSLSTTLMVIEWSTVMMLLKKDSYKNGLTYVIPMMMELFPKWKSMNVSYKSKTIGELPPVQVMVISNVLSLVLISSVNHIVKEKKIVSNLTNKLPPYGYYTPMTMPFKKSELKISKITIP